MVATTEFQIDLIADPRPAQAGLKKVDRALDKTEKEALGLRNALVRALSVRDQGATVALNRINQTLARGEEQALITSARIGQMGRDINDGNLRRFNKGLDATKKKASSTGRLLRRAFAGIGIVLLTRQFITFSDAVTNVNNRLKLVTNSTEDLASTQRELFEIANETRSIFEGTATIFTRLAQSSEELGKSNRQLLQFTKSLNQAIILSGASAAESSAGLIQLSQGLASGALRGDELRSVLEQLPAVARVISRDLGITIGQLRELGQQGLITSDIIIGAFERASESIEEDFAKTVPTIGQSFTVLRNKVLESVAAFNESTKVSEKFAEAVLFVADNVDDFALVLGATAAVLTTNYVVGMVIAAKSNDAFTASALRARLATLKLSAALALSVVAVVQVVRVFKELNGLLEDFDRNIREQDIERELNAQGAALNALRRERTLLNKAIAAQQSRGKSASESQLAQLTKLKAAEEALIATLRGRAMATSIAFKAIEEKLMAEKEATDAIKRQDALLKALEAPEAKRNQRVKDLNALLADGKGDATLLRSELEKLAEARRKTEARAAGPKDPFAQQLASISKRNKELQATAGLEGTLLKFAKASNDLKEQGRELGFIELGQLLAAISLEDALLASRKKQQAISKLNEGLQAREADLQIRASNADGARRDALLIANRLKTKGIELDEMEVANLTKKLERQREFNAAIAQQVRIENLAAQLDVTAQLAQAENDLLEVRRQFPALAEEVDQALQEMTLRQLEASTSLADGFTRAFAKIALEAEDLAAVGEKVVNTFADRGTDALIEFAKTGQFVFKEFANAILEDLIRIIARLLIVQSLSAITGGAGGLLGSAVNSGAQFGKTVQPGQAPLPVNEGGGKELFVPNRTGTIVPNAADVKQSSPVVNVNVSVVASPADIVREAVRSGEVTEDIIVELAANPEKTKQVLG